MIFILTYATRILLHLRYNVSIEIGEKSRLLGELGIRDKLANGKLTRFYDLRIPKVSTVDIGHTSAQGV